NTSTRGRPPRRVNGTIIPGRRTDGRPPIDVNVTVPVVYAMTQSTDPSDCSLIPDDEQGGRLAVEHLLAGGRTRIGHITGPERFLAARLRANGAVDALARAGHELAGGAILHGRRSEARGREASHTPP